MAVIVKYIVVRNGVEKMTFTTKKEADAYDKMLDISEALFELIESAEVDLNEKQLEDLSFFLAENKEAVISILKGVKPKTKSDDAKKSDPAEKTAKDKKTTPPKRENKP